MLNSLEIRHYKIRQRMLEYNGKVERSYRNDYERFYSYEDLLKQGKSYLKT